MSNSLIWWCSQLYVTTLDFVMMYVLAHTLMLKSLKIEKEHVLYNVLGIAMTTIAFYFFGTWTARIINHILLMWTVKKVIKRADGGDLLIIYLISGVLFGVIQGALLVVVGVFSLEQIITNAIAQSLTLIAFLGVCKLWKWHRLFHAIRSNSTLKLILAVLFLVSLISMFILNFNFDLLYMFFSLGAVTLISVIFSPIFVQVYQRVNGIISIEDIKTDLFATAVEMVEEADPEKQQQIFAMLAKQYGVDIASFPEKKRRVEGQEALVAHSRIVIKHQEGTEAIYTDNIMYIESSSNRKTKIMLENGQELLTANTISLWKKQLIGKNFAHPSQSYIVNFQHVDCIIIKDREIIMDDGNKFIIPVRNVAEINKEFYKYRGVSESH